MLALRRARCASRPPGFWRFFGGPEQGRPFDAGTGLFSQRRDLVPAGFALNEIDEEGRQECRGLAG